MHNAQSGAGGGSPVGIALVGAGRAGMVHGRNFARLVPGARVVAVADADSAAAQSAADELGAEKACADFGEAIAHPGVDAVLIASPTAFHCEIAVAAAEAGRHIFCEKPMAMDVGECDRMADSAARAGVVFQVGFMRRFDRGFVAAAERVAAGDIGEVVQVCSLTHGPSYPKPWMFDLAKSNGPLAEVNSHDIDTLRWLAGSEITEVYALAGNYRTPEARAEFPDFYDQVQMSVRFANGVQGSVRGAQGVQYAYDSRAEILGTSGLIRVGGIGGAATEVCVASHEIRRPSVVSWMDLFRDAYLAEDLDFVECVRTGRAPRAGAADGRAAVAVVFAGNRSIREGKPVSLPGEAGS
ncbi:Gfo/Idh/MocA family oxidoreductase [soil metagenome]